MEEKFEKILSNPKITAPGVGDFSVELSKIKFKTV